MVLSKRERYVVVATLISLTILLFDRVILGQIQQRRAAREMERRRILGELERARVTFARKKQLMQRWQQMLDAGMRFGPAQAESHILHAIRNWSQESGLSLSSLRPERAAQKGDLREITFQASATGRLNAVVGFLSRLESSPIPIKVVELQLGTRKEGTDDLSLQLRISALSQAAEPRTNQGAAAIAREEEKKND